MNTAVHQLRGDLDSKADAKAAFQTMQKAADMDYGPAETRLGQFYLSGTGTPVDIKKAAEVFDRAAFHGDAEGEYELGRLYNTGTGVERDQTMAIKLFTHAADKDLPQADFALGVASELGEGAPQDLPQAVKWYRKSAEQGFSVAQLRFAKMTWTATTGKQNQVAALNGLCSPKEAASKKRLPTCSNSARPCPPTASLKPKSTRTTLSLGLRSQSNLKTDSSEKIVGGLWFRQFSK